MIGISEDRFWDSTPKELDPYRKADEMREERNDYHNWMLGQYILSAVQTAVSGVLAGRKSTVKYIAEPILQSIKEENESNPEADFTKFCAWATVFNENFKATKGQGK